MLSPMVDDEKAKKTPLKKMSQIIARVFDSAAQHLSENSAGLEHRKDGERDRTAQGAQQSNLRKNSKQAKPTTTNTNPSPAPIEGGKKSTFNDLRASINHDDGGAKSMKETI